tara:strand:+ start:1928 stop:2254 length:327 start_codon:yes stop_codon:yes gene_type:complete
MSIFDNLLKVRESEKIKTEEDSYELIKEHMGPDIDIMDLSSHSKVTKYQTETRMNMFRFTIRLISLDFLNKMGNDRRVRNVYFTSRHSHPGGGADSISLRHQVIVEYH